MHLLILAGSLAILVSIIILSLRFGRKDGNIGYMMEDREHIIILGSLEVTSNAVVIGDLIWPPPEEPIGNVPNGLYEVKGTLLTHQNGVQCIAGFWIDVLTAIESQVCRSVQLAVDSGHIIVADPRGPVHPIRGESASRIKWVVREAAEEALDGGLYGTLVDDENRPWAVVMAAGLGDGAYDLLIEQANGRLVRLSCEFIES